MPVIVGEEEAALAASRMLADEGYLAAAIRPPTVPAGTARLRLTFTAQHPDDADRAAGGYRARSDPELMSAYFVTATGTDIGKTFVTAGLIRYLRERRTGRQCAQAGGERLRSLGGRDQRSGGAAQGARTTDRRRRHRRHRALALPRAAVARSSRPRAKSRSIDFDELIAFSRKAIGAANGMLFIEGVGGIMVPLDAERTVLDWMAALQIPLLLVVGGYLGTISHTLTALDVLAPRRLKIAAIVVSESERNPVELDDTVASIARFAHGVGVVGLPRLPGGLNQHPAFAKIAAHL